MSATIKYKGNTISSINTTASKTIKTSGKYCEADIVVENVQDGGIAPSGNKAIIATTDTQTGIDVAAYATVSVAPTPSETKSTTTNGEVTPASGKLLSKVTVNVPTGTARSSSDLTASGATVTVPAGLYSEHATKSVASGTAGTPTASKGSVSSHSVSVTPSVQNTAGYISGGTITGTPVTVAASELVSGNNAITAGTSTQTGIDVTNYATVSVAPTPSESKSTSSNGDVTPSIGKLLSKVTVNVPTGTARSSSDLTVSGATVTAPAGLYASSASKSVASGTQGTPTASKGTVSNHSVSVTPSCTDTTGYITGTTKTGTAVSVAASELVSGNLAITSNGTGVDVTNYATVSVAVPGPTTQTKNATPSLSSQTISPDSGKLLSSVTVDAITSALLANLDADFVAGNIKQGVDLFGLLGTFAGGGGGTLPGLEGKTVRSGTITLANDVNTNGVLVVNDFPANTAWTVAMMPLEKYDNLYTTLGAKAMIASVSKRYAQNNNTAEGSLCFDIYGGVTTKNNGLFKSYNDTNMYFKCSSTAVAKAGIPYFWIAVRED